MSLANKDTLVELIRTTFQEVSFPGAPFLQGSREGDEPYEEVGPFESLTDWQAIPAEFLDAHASALSFFSEGGLRFFLPAYLLADLEGKLHTADPLFHLAHGFYDLDVSTPVAGKVFKRIIGKSVLINPRRYGAATMYDYYRYRLSVFTREEAGAIVAYLEYKREQAGAGQEQAQIDAALDGFWRERARAAPTAASLRQQQADEQAYFDALRS